MATAPAQSTIKIFMASPSDVREERETLASLVREVNDVLVFLAPEQALQLELMRYETHTYPDLGKAQDVINRQIPQDYDIFVGVMWKRCGTPTATAPSGTIEEFNRAIVRRAETGSPTVMFYFCDEPFPPPRGDAFEQYARVLKFRDDLDSQGYTLSFPTRLEFRNHVRSGLLRAVADIVKTRKLAGTQSLERDTASLEPDSLMVELAAEYDNVRTKMTSGSERTKKMSDIKAEMLTRASSAKPQIEHFKNATSAGLRLAAIGILHQFPDSNQNDWLADRLNPDLETPYVGYSAAVALAQAVRSFSPYGIDADDRKQHLLGILRKALKLAERNRNDPPRLNVLKQAIAELERIKTHPVQILS